MIAGFRENVIIDHDNLVEKIYVSSITNAGKDSENRTLITITALIVAKGDYWPFILSNRSSSSS